MLLKSALAGATEWRWTFYQSSFEIMEKSLTPEAWEACRDLSMLVRVSL
jgi:hypothetical protein